MFNDGHVFHLSRTICILYCFYNILQAIPHAIAMVRAADKKSPREAVEFVLQLLKVVLSWTFLIASTEKVMVTRITIFFSWPRFSPTDRTF